METSSGQPERGASPASPQQQMQERFAEQLKKSGKRTRMSERRHRKAAAAGKSWPLSEMIVGVSIARSEDLLRLGMGEEHLREALRTICRPLLRYGADLAYGGYFRADVVRDEINYTREMVDLIGAEQDEGIAGNWIGRLYNFSPWPFCNRITAEDEARWIETCTFLRITEKEAGLLEDERVGDAADGVSSLRIVFNKAAVLHAMRRRMAEGMPAPGPASSDRRPVRAHARILIGGKLLGASGILPGIFEEALTSMDGRPTAPLYILGGFGGAAAALAAALKGKPNEPLPEPFDSEYYRKPVDGRESPHLRVEQAFAAFNQTNGRPAFLTPEEALQALRGQIERRRGDLGMTLKNGLTDQQNRRLFETTDAGEAAQLIAGALVTREPEIRDPA